MRSTPRSVSPCVGTSSTPTEPDLVVGMLTRDRLTVLLGSSLWKVFIASRVCPEWLAPRDICFRRGNVPVQKTATPHQTYSLDQLVPMDLLRAFERQQYGRQSLCEALGRLDARPWQNVKIAGDEFHRDRIYAPGLQRTPRHG